MGLRSIENGAQLRRGYPLKARNGTKEWGIDETRENRQGTEWGRRDEFMSSEWGVLGL